MKGCKSYSAIALSFLFAAAICCLQGCASMPAVPYEELTPRQRIVYMMGIYNMQYEDYKAKAVMPGLTQDQKDMLRKKLALLTDIYPMIQAYDLYINAGNMPDGRMENDIMGLLDTLECLAID